MGKLLHFCPKVDTGYQNLLGVKMKAFSLFFKTLPFFSVFIIILGGCVLRMGGYPLLPAAFLIPIYYWLVFRPDWLPLWSLFLIGLFYDALMGHNLGFSSLLLIVSAFLGQYSRPLLSAHSFLFIWAAFCLYSLGYVAFYGFFASVGLPLFLSWIYGIILYPLVAWGLSRLHLRLHSYG
jgi:rod shape-determining protein MreD